MGILTLVAHFRNVARWWPGTSHCLHRCSILYFKGFSSSFIWGGILHPKHNKMQVFDVEEYTKWSFLYWILIIRLEWLGWTCTSGCASRSLSSIKTFTIRIMRLGELWAFGSASFKTNCNPSCAHLLKNTMTDYKIHNQTNWCCLPKFVAGRLCISSIKTASV